MPGKTRDGKAEEPIEPGARWNIEPCEARPPREVVALHDALEALALARADDVDVIFSAEDRRLHLVAGIGLFAIAQRELHQRRIGGTPAFLKWPRARP